MKKLLTAGFLLIATLLTAQLYAQCLIGEVEVSIEVATDNWGYEVYMELVPTGNACGVGTIFAGGNTAQVGCAGGAQQTASAGGYANNSMTMEGPWCLLDGNTYDIKAIDDWGDGGTEFTVFIGGLPVYTFNTTGSNETFSFLAASPPQYNAGMDHIDTYSYVNPGTVDIDGVLGNYGSDTIATIDLNYSINGGATITQSLSGLNILPFTEYGFLHTTPWTAVSNGAYNLLVWTSNVNGNPDMDTSNDTLGKVIEVGDPIPNIIDSYLSSIPNPTVIVNSSNQVASPQDLDFHPVLSRKELWVVNKNTENSGGSTVKISAAGEISQTSLWQRDQNAWHFMSLPTGISFGENENFGTSPGVFDANHNGGAPFTGPALWSSDPAVYAQPSGGNGSHLDMLHSSPYCMGIAHEVGNAFWVFDANNNDIVRYDFGEDHGPGNADHDDGRIRRVTSFAVDWINSNIASHLAMDKATGWLYIVDGSGPRVLRMDVTSGTASGSPTYAQSEPLAEYSNLNNVTWEVVADSGLVEPSGIAVIEDRLLVSDHANGDIIVYDISGVNAVEIGRIVTGAAGIMGITIGPEGYIWYVNATTNEVFKIEQSAVSIQNGLTSNQVQVYPNPAKEQAYITWGDADLMGGTIIIRDMVGKQVKHMTVNTAARASINIADLSAGSYMVEIQFQGNRMVVDRLTKI